MNLTGTGDSLTLKNGQNLTVNAGSNNAVTLGTGNDTVSFASGANFNNAVLGPDLSGSAHGGDNTLTGGDYSGNSPASPTPSMATPTISPTPRSAATIT